MLLGLFAADPFAIPPEGRGGERVGGEVTVEEERGAGASKSSSNLSLLVEVIGYEGAGGAAFAREGGGAGLAREAGGAGGAIGFEKAAFDR